MTRAAHIGRTIRTAQRLDKDWLHGVAQTAEERELYTPWQPYPVVGFLELLFEGLPDAVEAAGDDPRFLEIGCGPGSKLLLARDIGGLSAHGIDRVQQYTSVACTMGLPAKTADAENWPSYGSYDLLWLNRPMRNQAREIKLEQQVWRTMKPGAVVMVYNTETTPPGNWIIVLDDWGDRRGIWQKPLAIPGR